MIQRQNPASVLAPNRLQQKFEVANPNDTWVTDITHIRTHEGWLYLAVVIDLPTILSQGGRLVNALTDQERISVERSTDGGMAQKTAVSGDHSL